MGKIKFNEVQEKKVTQEEEISLIDSNPVETISNNKDQEQENDYQDKRILRVLPEKQIQTNILRWCVKNWN